jgi:anti-sigma28 factor (negative regulator of flagellin synthesis)
MEEITLEKIDILRQRTGIGYAEAKEILEKHNGNVIDSLIYIEQNQKKLGAQISEFSNDLVETIREIIRKGNVNRIKVKKDDRVLIDIPVTAGIAAGAVSLFNPLLIAVGAITAVVSKIKIEIERPDGRVEVVEDIVKEKVEEVKENIKDTVDDFKNTFNEKFKNDKENKDENE